MPQPDRMLLGVARMVIRQEMPDLIGVVGTVDQLADAYLAYAALTPTRSVESIAARFHRDVLKWHQQQQPDRKNITYMTVEVDDERNT